MQGRASIPFVNRYAEGTAERLTRIKAALTQQLGRSPSTQELSRALREDRVANPTPATPTTPVTDIESLIRQKLENNTLSYSDFDSVGKAGNVSLATAIYRYLNGAPWEYTWTTESTTPTPTTPTTPTAPTTPAQPEMNPQVIWYDPGVWAKNPTTAYLNNAGGQTQNKFSGLGKFASYDPATQTDIQAPEKMNAFRMMEIDRDPVRRDFTESLYNRHGRSWEKELADSIRMAPMGSATSYVRSG